MSKALFWSLISGGTGLVLGILIAMAWVNRRPNPTPQMVLSTPTPTPDLPPDQELLQLPGEAGADLCDSPLFDQK